MSVYIRDDIYGYEYAYGVEKGKSKTDKNPTRCGMMKTNET